MYKIKMSKEFIQYFIFICFSICVIEINAQDIQGGCEMTMSPESLQKIIERDKLRNLNRIEASHRMAREVPVKIHIIGNDVGGGRLNASVAEGNLITANSVFNGVFNFTQCGEVNYIDNDDYTTMVQDSNDEFEMAANHRVNNVLNVFYVPEGITASGSIGSWSAFPNNPNKDWIVMRNAQAMNNSTFSHEVGHWFDLLHTFETALGVENISRITSTSFCVANCLFAGDLLCDTPADRDNSWSGCSFTGSGGDGCGEPLAPLEDNIMRSSTGGANCRTSFTPDQLARMRDSYDFDRDSQLGVCGCTDQNALNYNIFATVNDGSCVDPLISGCTNPSATNYNPSATFDDGSCTFPAVPGCTNPSATNYNPAATVDNGSCTFPAVPGCTDPSANNYNPSATQDDGSCIFTVSGCTDPNAVNYNPQANQNTNGACQYCIGTTTLTSSSGVLYDGSGGPEYGNNSNCKWLIQPTGVNSFVLEFTAFFLESGFDFVKVYDGSTTSAPLMGSFTGFNIPPKLYTSSGAILIHFTSDGATTSYGWTANYSPITNPCEGIANLNITSNPIPNGNYFARNNIITANPSNSNPVIDMTAGRSIVLNPGFDGISNGSGRILMEIEDCPNNFTKDQNEEKN